MPARPGGPLPGVATQPCHTLASPAAGGRRGGGVCMQGMAAGRACKHLQRGAHARPLTVHLPWLGLVVEMEMKHSAVLHGRGSNACLLQQLRQEGGHVGTVSILPFSSGTHRQNWWRGSHEGRSMAPPAVAGECPRGPCLHAPLSAPTLPPFLPAPPSRRSRSNSPRRSLSAFFPAATGR